MSNKKTCFVIQPFSEPYKTRYYENIYKPAIEKVGLMPRRVGNPGDNIITEEIEQGIRNASACLAEITPSYTTVYDGKTNYLYFHNPNVWYELGFTFACNKPVSMICNSDILPLRKLPFDISTKYIIGYTKSVDSDKHTRTELIHNIAEDIQKKIEVHSKFASSSQEQKPEKDINISLSDNATIALSLIITNDGKIEKDMFERSMLDRYSGRYSVSMEMDKFGTTRTKTYPQSLSKLDINHAINKLLVNKLIKKDEFNDREYYCITEKGRIFWDMN